MSLLDEIEEIVENARAYERILRHVQEVVSRPIIKDTLWQIDSDEIDGDWIADNLGRLLVAHAQQLKTHPYPAYGDKKFADLEPANATELQGREK